MNFLRTDLLDAILNNSCDGIFVADSQYNTIAYSETYRKYLGASKKQMETKNVLDFYNEGWLSDVPLRKVIESRQVVSGLISYYRTGKDVYVTGVPVIVDGEIEYVVLSFRDLEIIHSVESELEKSQFIIKKYQKTIDRLQNQTALVDVQEKYGIVYRSDAMHRLIKQLEIIANYDINVLITGETGVGKTMIARIIHQLGDRSKEGAFQRIDCGAIPDNLIESELFGYVSGSFTGAADKGKMGLIEQAHKGTLLFDEISELPMLLQSKLLTFIEDKTFLPIGATQAKTVNTRILAATNKNLETYVQEGLFRKDLFYRLNVLTIEVPPLSKRREDIIPIARFYDEFFAEKYGLNNLRPEVYDYILTREWEGNVRELIHFVERTIITGEFHQDRKLHNPSEDKNTYEEINLKEYLERVERAFLIEQINRTNTLKECAEKLGIDPSTLSRKIRSLGIQKVFRR